MIFLVSAHPSWAYFLLHPADCLFYSDLGEDGEQRADQHFISLMQSVHAPRSEWLLSVFALFLIFRPTRAQQHVIIKNSTMKKCDCMRCSSTKISGPAHVPFCNCVPPSECYAGVAALYSRALMLLLGEKISSLDPKVVHPNLNATECNAWPGLCASRGA